MSKIFFFTDENSISQIQNQDDAFGPISNEGSIQRYNLENKFSLAQNSPAIAVTKSLLLAIPSSDPNLVNIALLPLNSYTLGFPIKLFIYRGIRVDSLVESNGNVKLSNNTWKSDNILKVVKENQDKINAANNTNIIATSSSLGFQFSAFSNEVFIESIFFNNIDDFHPLIVNAGCQIGKFAGGTIKGGVEVILDIIGREPNLGILKSEKHIFEIESLSLNNNSFAEDMIDKFNHRNSKEEVLAYLDISAFYGNSKNQKIKVKGVDNGEYFLNNFLNKNIVYIDLRDNWGFSFDHFFKLNDSVCLGFEITNQQQNEIVFDEYDYYSNWPILALNNLEYQTSKKNIFLKIPILVGNQINENILSSFSGKFSLLNDNSKFEHILLKSEINGLINFRYSETIKLTNWCYDDNKLGANYFLFKVSTIYEDNVSNQEIIGSQSQLFENFFNLKMKNIFGFDQIEDGEYRVFDYSSLNNPVIKDYNSGRYYLSNVGIGVDKSNVTLFKFMEKTIINKSSFLEKKFIPFISKGKFKSTINPEDYEFNNTQQCVGFLDLIVSSQNSRVENLQLSKYSIQNPSNLAEELKFLYYSIKIDYKHNNMNELFEETFDSIVFTHDEYFLLLDRQTQLAQLTSNHPIFLNINIQSVFHFTDFKHLELNVSTGEINLIENEENLDLSFFEIISNQNQLINNNTPVLLNVTL